MDQLGEEIGAKGETPPAPYTEKTGFHIVHQTLVSTGSVRPVSGGRQRAASVNRPDAVSGSDRTLAVSVRSELTYGDAGRAEAGE